MKRFILKRLLQFIPVILGVTFITFLLMYLSPGDPVNVALTSMGLAVSPEIIAQKKAEMGLDQPFLVQYGKWLFYMFQGDFGKSLTSHLTVSEKLLAALPASLILCGTSMLLTLIVSIPLGILAAVKQNSRIDYLIRFCTFVNASVPNFTYAVFLIYLVALKLRLVPVLVTDSIVGIILPSLTLMLSMSSRYIRQIRSVVLDELSKDYVKGARIRGFGEKTILYKEVLKNILVSIVTLTGLSIGSLMGGAVVVETIFAWPGMGKLAMDAINARDYPVVQGFVVWMAFAYVFVNLLTDIAYYLIDPRIKEQEK